MSGDRLLGFTMRLEISPTWNRNSLLLRNVQAYMSGRDDDDDDDASAVCSCFYLEIVTLPLVCLVGAFCRDMHVCIFVRRSAFVWVFVRDAECCQK